MGIDAAITALSSLLGDRLSRSKSDLALHGRSETHFNNMLPDAIAYPKTTDEVSAILKICHAENCPVTAWGTGTSLEGHALPLHGGLSLDLRLMDQVLAIHTEDMDVVVQPGVTRQVLNTELRATGLFFPVDPGANASLGGMAATRASGTTAVRYGTMRDNVMGLEVVLSDGRIIRTGTRAQKSSAGYDLTALMVGSEGTLGIIIELTLKLQGQPEATAAAICAFETVDAAVQAVMTTIQCGIPMARIEFVDSSTARAFNRYADRDMPEKPHLMVEFHGSETAVGEDAQRLGQIVTEFGGSDFQWSAQTEDRNALWALRHDAYYACLGLRPGATAVVTDVCVPISRLAQAVEETRADISDSPLDGPILGHVGDGNFHAILLVEPNNRAELKEALRLSSRMTDRALALGGTVSGEHGVGMGKLGYMPLEHGEAWSVMGDIKTALDPKNILNPGKMIKQD